MASVSGYPPVRGSIIEVRVRCIDLIKPVGLTGITSGQWHEIMVWMVVFVPWHKKNSNGRCI
jgi:hypothetical protein